MSRFRVLIAAASVVATLVLSAGPAAAHAVVVSANPSPATGLPEAPGSVVIRFTEPLNRRLSRIRVLDHGGRDVGIGPTTAVAGDSRAMARRLGALRPDRYTVAWTTVSSLDGHTLRGSYTFGVGVDATAGVAVHDNPVSSEGWLGLAGRLVALGGLVGWAGVAVAGPAAIRGGLARSRLRRVARAAPAMALVGTAASVVSSAVVSSGSLARVGDVVGTSGSGHWRVVLAGAAAIGAVLPAGWMTGYRALGALAIVAEAAAGHAAATAAPAVATASFALHLGAVGVWVFAVLAACLSSPRAGGEGLARSLRVLSPWAIVAAAAVALTGVANAAFELSRPGDLGSSGYGRAVAAKAGLFVAMAGFGVLHHWRRTRGPSGSGLAFPLRAELVSALVALAVATALVGFPSPPHEAEAAERGSSTDAMLGRLGGMDALSLAGASGPFVMGLTMLPPRPGPVEVRLQVVGMDAGDGLRDAHVHGLGPEGDVFDASLVGCGLGCFAGRGVIGAAGGWHLEATAVSNRGPLVFATDVPLPAVDGSAELQRALGTLGQLRSARMHEALRGSADGPVISSDYAFAAPDRFEFSVNGSDEIVIGDRSFRRDGPDRAWTAELSGYSFEWPGSSFRSFWGPGVAARIVGEEPVDGVASRVVAFVRPDLPAWLRIWVGTDDGLVRREEMRTAGHLMDHTWTDFDQPVDIRPPR